jgi:hypothetical protein
MPKITSMRVRWAAMVLVLAGVFTGDSASRRGRVLLTGMM